MARPVTTQPTTALLANMSRVVVGEVGVAGLDEAVQ